MNTLAVGAVATGPFSGLGTVVDDVLLMDLLFGIFAFWPVLFIMVMALWNPAPRLSHRIDLALPETLRRRLNRFLRARLAVLALGLLVLSQVLLALSDVPSGLRASHVGELALLPTSIWLPCLLVSLWPRWRSKGPIHLAHLRRLCVRDALTDWEWAAIATAYTASAVLIAWALARAGLAAWSAVAVAVLACQALLTYAIARRVVGAPAAGSDNLELAWDDALRLQRVRALAASGSFVTLWCLIAAAGDLTGIATFSSKAVSIPLMVAMSAGVFAWYRSAAHRNWRRAWPAARPPTTGPPRSAP